jgi:hypothetical protein
MDESPYALLDTKLQEIRLFEIAPGNQKDDLVISVRIKRLPRKRPKFIALPYAWGRGICLRKAVVHSQSMTIGQNFDDALRQLRKSMSDHMFWIDALCINQQDIEERIQQIQIMGKIYSSADQVLIWLGPERKNYKYAIDMIKQRRISVPVDDALHLMRVTTWYGFGKFGLREYTVV